MTEAETAPRRRRAGSVAGRLFAAVTLGYGALLLGTRALVYLWPTLPDSWWGLLDPVLETGAMLTVTAFKALPPQLGLFAVVGLFWLLRPSWFVRRVEGRLALASWVLLGLCLVFMLNTHLLDLNRFLALFTWFTLPLGPLAFRLGRPRLWPGAALWAVIALLGIAAAPTAPDALGVSIWCVWQVLLFGRLRRHVRDREIWIAAIAGSAAVQSLASSPDLITPLAVILAAVFVVRVGRRLARRRRGLGWLAVPLMLAALGVAVALPPRLFEHGGRLLGEGLAYSFCERPERGSLYAAVPHCGTGSPGCIAAVVAEYDAESLRPKGRYRVLTPDRYGRIEQLACYDDQIEVGMCCVLENGEWREEGALRFDADEPGRIETRRAGDWLARRLVHDELRDAILYVGNRVVRYDRKSDTLDKTFGDALEAVSSTNVRPGSIFVAEKDSLARSRDSLFVGEFMRGSKVHELDLDAGAVRASMPAHNGGVVAATVDEPLGRLYVTSLLGVDVYELDSRRLIARLRTGMLARFPVVDAKHDLIYVPATAEGRIHAFDRRSLERLGAIPIGLETRNAFMTSDGRWLLGSGTREHFAWDAELLARRFREQR
jgi:hypothetical protein